MTYALTGPLTTTHILTFVSETPARQSTDLYVQPHLTAGNDKQRYHAATIQILYNNVGEVRPRSGDLALPILQATLLFPSQHKADTGSRGKQDAPVFKAYYNKQNYSLSGYFHDSSNLGFDSIKALPLVEEWLDTNNYVMCQCPSHSEEMIPIGVLCYSSPFLHREELKQAIVNRHEWQQFTSTPPVSDIYLGDIVAAEKKTKMLFISSERSRQQDLTTLFKKLYDATDKHYPNGT